MALVPRNRKGGKVVYNFSFEHQGRKYWIKLGPNKREAELEEKRLVKSIKAGDFDAVFGTKSITVEQYFEHWIAKRRVRSKDYEEGWVRRHLLGLKKASPGSNEWVAAEGCGNADLKKLHIAEWRPRHTLILVHGMQRKLDKDGKRALRDKSIQNLLSVLHVMFRDAMIEELCTMNPIIVPEGTLDCTREKEPVPYTPTEVRLLTRSAKIHPAIRMLNALCFLTGQREGEACGRRWVDLSIDTTPLWCLYVHDQYDHAPLKTDNPRIVPVHPELAELLEEWGRRGYEMYTGRKPAAEDFIVPNLSPRASKRHHTKDSYYHQFIRACNRTGVEPRTLHATRHTFLTLARRGGARKDVIEKVTHNARGDIVDRYTHFDYAPLCEAVLCLNLDAHRDLHPDPRKKLNSGSVLDWNDEAKRQNLLESADSESGGGPSAVDEKPLAGSEFENPRLGRRSQSGRNSSPSAGSELGSAIDGLKLNRPPRDVQRFVAKRMVEAHAAIVTRDAEGFPVINPSGAGAALRPLARAARALDTGRVPRRKRAV